LIKKIKLFTIANGFDRFTGLPIGICRLFSIFQSFLLSYIPLKFICSALFLLWFLPKFPILFSTLTKCSRTLIDTTATASSISGDGVNGGAPAGKDRGPATAMWVCTVEATSQLDEKIKNLHIARCRKGYHIIIQFPSASVDWNRANFQSTRAAEFAVWIFTGTCLPPWPPDLEEVPGGGSRPAWRWWRERRRWRRLAGRRKMTVGPGRGGGARRRRVSEAGAWRRLCNQEREIDVLLLEEDEESTVDVCRPKVFFFSVIWKRAAP
jgi:hypothetical protein